MRRFTFFFLFLTLLTSTCSESAEISEGIDRLKSLYFAASFEEGYYEGQALVERFPNSSELRAAYSGETGHPIRGKWPPGRSEATLGIS